MWLTTLSFQRETPHFFASGSIQRPMTCSLSCEKVFGLIFCASLRFSRGDQGFPERMAASSICDHRKGENQLTYLASVCSFLHFRPVCWLTLRVLIFLALTMRPRSFRIGWNWLGHVEGFKGGSALLDKLFSISFNLDYRMILPVCLQEPILFLFRPVVVGLLTFSHLHSSSCQLLPIPFHDVSSLHLKVIPKLLKLVLVCFLLLYLSRNLPEWGDLGF